VSFTTCAAFSFVPPSIPRVPHVSVTQGHVAAELPPRFLALLFCVVGRGEEGGGMHTVCGVVSSVSGSFV
jgi:hypothetical protein